MFYESYDRQLNYKQSKAFLELCFKEASYFTLLDMTFREYDGYNRELEECLKPFQVGVIINKDGQYGGSTYLKDTPSGMTGEELTAYVYEVNEESKAAFLSIYPGIYMDCEEIYHKVDRKIPQPSSLCDVMFLDDEKRVIVEAIAHEGIVRISQQEGLLSEYAQKNKKLFTVYPDDDVSQMRW